MSLEVSKSSVKDEWYLKCRLSPRVYVAFAQSAITWLSAKAGDDILGAPPPRPASLLRELMHMGQVVQSHGMHFFELAGPDLILGFDADPAIRNVVGLLAADPGLTVRAVNLRKWGQEIIRILGGRRIHPNFAIPGGVNKALTKEERAIILDGYDESIETIKIGLRSCMAGLRRMPKTLISLPS